MARDFGVEGNPAPRERSQGVLGGRGGRVDAAGPVGGAAFDERFVAEPVNRFTQRRRAR